MHKSIYIELLDRHIGTRTYLNDDNNIMQPIQKRKRKEKRKKHQSWQRMIRDQSKRMQVMMKNKM
jgi:hypothetical protein